MIIIFFIIMSCHVEKSFNFSTYWWKNSAEINNEQNDFLVNNNLNKIYLKIFDLKFDEKNFRITTPRLKSSFKNKGLTIIPVIYIENAVLLNFNIDSIFITLKENIRISINNGIISNTDVLQIDCDWTLKSKKSYFKLLSLLKHETVELSATIRLHQIKYFELTGVPPVDKGVMMIYNLNSPGDTNTNNSIFTYNNAIQYLNKNLINYPIKLDVALPAFSWGVHYHQGKIKNLISDFDPRNINNKNMYQKKNGDFQAKKAHFYNTYRISNRDIIRYEYPKIKGIRKMINYLNNNLDQEDIEIIFFSLNSDFLINNKTHYENIISTYQ